MPLDRELVVRKPDEKYKYPRLRMGDGKTNVNDLPEINVQPDWEQTDPSQPDYIRNKPEINSGSATSWNDLTDKPFGEEVTEGVLTFDGDLTGREYIDYGDGYCFVKMSDRFLTEEDLAQATITFWNNGSTYDANAVIESQTLGDLTVIIVLADHEISGGMVVTLNSDAPLFGEPPMSAGTWFQYVTDVDSEVDSYPISLSCLTGLVGTIKTLDEKYIPDSIARTEDILTEEDVSTLINKALGVIENGTY